MGQNHRGTTAKAECRHHPIILKLIEVININTFTKSPVLPVRSDARIITASQPVECVVSIYTARHIVISLWLVLPLPES
jgi:hypothetical protein